MIKALFAVPGDLETLTGGYGYDRRVLALAPTLGHLRLPDGFPFPSAGEIADAVARLRTAPPDRALLIDGLAYGALPPDALAEFDGRLIALTHHPLGLETGLSEEASRRLVDNEREGLRHASAVIVTSMTTAETLVAEFGVPMEKITVAEPGVDPAPRAKGSGDPVVALLAVGSIMPRKGFDTLVRAVAPLAHLPWRLTIAGSTERDPACAASLRGLIAECALQDRIELVGELSAERLGARYDRADVFVLSSRYEGYGMVLSEAMARGLAIVTTTGGAAARTAPDDAALKVAPDDARGLGEAIASLIADAPLREKLAEASWQAGQKLPGWEAAADTVTRVVERVAGSLK